LSAGCPAISARVGAFAAQKILHRFVSVGFPAAEEVNVLSHMILQIKMNIGENCGEARKKTKKIYGTGKRFKEKGS